MKVCRRCTPADRTAAYRVLDHPADLWLEVFGAGLPQVRAELWGESLDRERHELLAEVKAVTYHRLQAEAHPAGSWRAAVLLDV